MKIAVIGKGKTGSEVLRACVRSHEAESFHSKNIPTIEKLQSFDLAIVFIPASAFADLAGVFLEAKIPMVIGTTGFSFEKISAPQSPWIVGSNFSLGMNAMFAFSSAFAGLAKFAPAAFHIHEIHHVEKKDKPSGTALHLQKILPQGTEISSERIGDVRGEHLLEISLPAEKLSFRHEALDRSVFASGALYAAEKLLIDLPPGIHSFENLFAQKIRKELFYA